MADVCGATTRLTLSPFEPDHPSVVCTREVQPDGRHVGDHQGIDHVPAHPGDPTADWSWLREDRPAYDRLVTWGDGGGRSHKYDPPEPNRNCMCVTAEARGDRYQLARLGHTSADHRWTTCGDCGCITDTTAPDPALCSMCTIWSGRVRAYTDGPDAKGGRHVRFHDDAFSGGIPRLYGWSPGSSGAFGGRVVTVHCDDGTVLGPADSLWDNGAIPWWLIEAFPPNARYDVGEQVARPGHTDPFGQPLAYTAHPEVPRA